MAPRSTIQSILFVCMGNICRSPLAEGVARVSLRHAGLDLRLDSAGTHDYHPGAAPDERARAVGREFGYPIDDLRARRVRSEDFSRFDLILAADASNLRWLQQHRPEQAKADVALLLPWCGAEADLEVPDPYYADMEAFRGTVRLLQGAMPGLLERLRGQA
ncbi:MAG TPA: low molecular weight protein-tyrosine-phosphatase [Chiayiivirga sp.]|nr:low molecular weight protein-tyrosine-phosphatase [Chiayiivirga sp.]